MNGVWSVSRRDLPVGPRLTGSTGRPAPTGPRVGRGADRDHGRPVSDRSCRDEIAYIQVERRPAEPRPRAGRGAAAARGAPADPVAVNPAAAAETPVARNDRRFTGCSRAVFRNRRAAGTPSRYCTSNGRRGEPVRPGRGDAQSAPRGMPPLRQAEPGRPHGFCARLATGTAWLPSTRHSQICWCTCSVYDMTLHVLSRHRVRVCDPAARRPIALQSGHLGGRPPAGMVHACYIDVRSNARTGGPRGSRTAARETARDVAGRRPARR